MDFGRFLINQADHRTEDQETHENSHIWKTSFSWEGYKNKKFWIVMNSHRHTHTHTHTRAMWRCVIHSHSQLNAIHSPPIQLSRVCKGADITHSWFCVPQDLCFNFSTLPLQLKIAINNTQIYEPDLFQSTSIHKNVAS
jgi:hypothetical protein